jgi:hypothetical protein
MFFTTLLFVFFFVVVLFGIYLVFIFKLLKNKSFLAFLVIVIAPYIAYKVFQYSWYVAALPPEIAITWPIAIGDESYIREGCGVAIFKLSKATSLAIEAKGLDFFTDATQARGHPHHYYYKYKKWKETPVPSTWISEGTWIRCSVVSDDLIRQITEVAQQKGSYYTTKSEGELIVFPGLGWVVFSYYG